MLAWSMPAVVIALAIGLVLPFSQSEAMEVVYKGRRTISTQPFYAGIKIKSSGKRAAKKRAIGENPYALENRLPIVSKLLQPGVPQIIESPQQQPVFVLGGDRSSQQWFLKEAQALAKLGATGVVVSLASMAQWEALETIAERRGLRLHAVSGDAVAEAYGITTYPVVIVGEGMHGR